MWHNPVLVSQLFCFTISSCSRQIQAPVGMNNRHTDSSPLCEIAVICVNAPARVAFRKAYGAVNSARPRGLSTGGTATGREAALRSQSGGKRTRW